MSAGAVSPRLVFANQLRGIAAVFVMLSHYVGVFWLLQDALVSPTVAPAQGGPVPGFVLATNFEWFSPGPFGVGLFFMISGLVVPISLQRHTRASFLAARILRIYPTYAAGMALQVAILLAASRIWGHVLPYDWRTVLANVLLVHDLVGRPSMDLVNWTLTIELRFYLLVMALAPFLRRGSLAALFWPAASLCGLALLIALHVFGPVPIDSSRLIYTVSSELPFLVLMLTAVLFNYHVRGLVGTRTLAGGVALGAAMVVFTWWFGVLRGQFTHVLNNYAYALAVFGLAYALRGRIRRNWLLDRLAAISYPLYLVHVTVGFFVMKALMLLLGVGYPLALAAAFVAAGLCATVLHWAVERPCIRAGHDIAGWRLASPPQPAMPARPVPLGWLLALCLAGGAAFSVALGQDANWDLLNYHLYNGYAFLHGRFARDLLPAGMQGSLNPLLDASYAGLALGPLRYSPRVLAAAMGLWYGALVYFAARLSLLLHADRWIAAIAALLAVTGAAALSQLGTTTGEVQVAAVMLAGLLAILRGAGHRRAAAGGLLFGLAAGLKLTAAAYAPAGLLASLCMAGPKPRRWLGAGAAFSACWAAAVLAVDGWWAAWLYRRFGSPTFPMFNGVFRSPLYPPASIVDDRFFPHGVWQWLSYPLTWALSPSAAVSEFPLQDPRLAIALAACVALALLWRRSQPPAVTALLAFFAAGYVTWLRTSSILRYAVVLEVSGGLLVPVLLARLLPPGIVCRSAMAALAATVLALTQDPVTLRVPYGSQVLQASAAPIPPGTLLVLARPPVSYLVAMLDPPPDVQVIGVGDVVLEARGWGLHDAMARAVANQSGPIRVIVSGDPAGSVPELAELGLSPQLTACQVVGNTLEGPGTPVARLCTGEKAAPPVLSSPFWAQAAARYRTVLQVDDGSQRMIAAAFLRAAGPAARGMRFVDWSDLLWSRVGSAHDALPQHLDGATLYVLSPASLLDAADRSDPAHDLLARVDGLLVLAPGWHDCAACTAPAAPVRLLGPATPLALGTSRAMGTQAAASGYLAGGWWPLEPGGIWSTQAAGLLLPLAADLPEHAVLYLDGVVFGPPHPVHLALAGSPASVTQAASGPARLALPLQRDRLWRQPDGTYVAHVQITIPDAPSPASLGLSADPRRLGLHLDALELVAAP